MSTYRIYPTESLTWDDVCQFWDNDVFTADDVKNIAPLYFEKAELTAVLEVIEKVENDSYTPETMELSKAPSCNEGLQRRMLLPVMPHRRDVIGLH